MQQNDFRHFTVAQRTFITCFRRVMIIFDWHLLGKTFYRNVLRASQKIPSLVLLWRTKHVMISSFPLQMPAKSTVTRLKHACYCKTPDFAITQAWNCGNSAISTQDARAGPDLQLRWKMCAVLLRSATISPSNMPGTRSEPRDRRVDAMLKFVQISTKIKRKFKFGFQN